jgi:predicted acyltransferase
MTVSDATPAKPKHRIASIDQFRGFAIFGMLLVDYFGLYKGSLLEPGESTGFIYFLAVLWKQVHHASGTGVTFADTIAPIFMFVVGMGMRLSFQRRAMEVGPREARKSVFKRYCLLVLIAFTVYTGYLWDALLNIGLAGLLAVMLVDRKPSIRFGAGLVLLAAYQAVFSLTSYGPWLYRTLKYDDAMPFIWKIIPFGPELVDCPINGGPIGHWSWCLMLLCGTIAYDLMATKNVRKIVIGCLAWGIALCVAGWVFKMEWPGVKAFWPFCKNYMTAPFALWTSGLCFLYLLAFYVVCDLLKLRIPHMTVLGLNPLFIYILQWCIIESAHRFIPEQTTNWTGIMAGSVVFYAVCYGTAYFLYRKKILIKL